MFSERYSSFRVNLSTQQLTMLTNEMQHLDGRKTAVDAAHEAFQEDDFAQANAHAPQVAREAVEVVEVVQLHSVGEVQGHGLEGWALVGELMQHGGGDKLTGQLDVLEGGPKAHADEGDEGFLTVHVQPGVLGAKRHNVPQAAVVGQQPPFPAHLGHLAQLAMFEEGENLQHQLLWQLLDRQQLKRVVDRQ